jgi:hypothetical protein
LMGRLIHLRLPPHLIIHPRFLIQTAYTKPHPARTGYLCYECTVSFGIDPLAKPKKKTARKPAVKEKRAKVISYEEIKGALPLGDLCIKVSTRPQGKLRDAAQWDADCDSITSGLIS